MAPLKRFRFSFREFMLLPVRICYPPCPTVGKVRSCGVTPIYKVQLEDVLDRKHLPPLGLKDFEEWLLFVEQAPENLYFILWLREYRAQYEAWATSQREKHQAIATSSHPRHHGHSWPSYNSQLAQFYLRARQTFFSSQSIYELNLPADLLGPLLASSPSSPHPDPAVFDAIAVEVQTMLKESLSRFVIAAYSNVGTSRGLCGVIVGTFVLLVCSIVPLCTAIMLSSSRWVRLTAFPGTWLGFTIMLASLHGVCLSVYVFGDVRQLRRFELYPDPPRPKPAPRPVTAPAAPYQERPKVRVPSPTKIVISQPPPCDPSPPPSNRSHSSLSIYSMMYPPTISDEGYEGADETHRRGHSIGNSIEISPEYYDDDPIEGPATSPMSTHFSPFSFHPNQKSKKDLYSRTFMGTATFIHPYSGGYEDLNDDDFENCDDDGDMFGNGGVRRLKRLPEECQLVTSFDFDELPLARSPTPVSTAPSTMTMATSTCNMSDTTSIAEPEPAVVVDSGMTPIELKMNLDMVENGHRRNAFEPSKRRLCPRTILARIQTRCTLDKWGSFIPSLGRRHKPSFTSSMMTAVQPPLTPTSPTTPTVTCNTGVQFHPSTKSGDAKKRKSGKKTKGKTEFLSKEQRIALRFKLARAVPAFASPLTRVLSPVVKRAQWEVVVRSALVAFICTWAGVGALLAIPVRH